MICNNEDYDDYNYDNEYYANYDDDDNSNDAQSVEDLWRMLPVQVMIMIMIMTRMMIMMIMIMNHDDGIYA